MSWSQAVSETRKSHPDLVSARESWNQSKADKAVAVSNFLPQVQGSAGGTRSKASKTSPRIDSYAYEVSGSQLVFDSFKTVFDVEQAARGVDAAHYRYQVTSSDVRFDLRSAFLTLLRAQELLRITEDIAARRRQSRDQIQLRYDAGREHKGSLMVAEANLAQADFEVAQAQRNEILAQRRFLVRMGRSAFTDVEVEGTLDLSTEPGPRPDAEKLAEATPFLRALIVLKEAARWGVKSAVSDFFPQVYMTGGIGKSGAEWPPERQSWDIGASVTMPFFEGGANVANLARSRAIAAQAAADEKSGRNGVILTLEEAWKAYRDAADNVGVQKKFLDAALERGKIAGSEYSTGLIAFNDWVIIEDALVRAEKTYLDARLDALTAEAAWEQAKGETLDEE